MNIFAMLATLYKNRYVISTIGVVFLLLACYGYYQHTSRKIESLQNTNEELSRLVETQKQQIESLRVNYNDIIKAKDDLSKEVINLKEQQRTEEQRLYRENQKKKSLEELAIRKSGLIQKAVNKATKRVFDCFVLLSEGGDC